MSRFYGDFDPASTATTTVTTEVVDTSSVVLYMPFDEDIQDDSGVGTSMAGVGGAFVQSSLTQFGAKALYLDGSGDYLQSLQKSSANSIFTLSSASFTIDGWLYPQTFNEIISNFNASNPFAGFTASMNFNPHAAGKLAFFTSNGSSYDTSMASSTAFALNQWSHFAIVRGGISANSLEFFINGVKHGSHTVTKEPGTSNNVVRIGASNNSQPNRQFRGAMDDLRIVKGKALYSTNFSVPTTAVGTSIITEGTVINTRTHSHVCNYTDVYDARFADTWPGLPTPLTWDTTTAGSDVLITNENMTVTIDDTGSDWPNNSAISVESHSSGKVYYEATIAGSAHSGYLRVGVVQNQGSATIITIQSDRMGVWDGNAPAHANKSENRSEVNGSQVDDGSQTHSSGDVFMYALDIDNARAYFGRNGSFDLSFDPVNGTGGYNIASLSGYNSTDPWHILFQSLRSDQGVVTLRTAGEAQYLPSGYSYWGTI